MNKQLIRELVRTENPILFEIGSADGRDTLEFIDAFNDTDFRLYCFEPYINNTDIHKKNIFDKRVILSEVAVGNVDGYVEFNYSLGKNIYSSSLKNPTNALYRTWPELFKNGQSFQKGIAMSIRLDTFVQNNSIDKIDFVWMDCQGAEDLVIEGGNNTFLNKVKYLYTEFSNQEIYENQPTIEQILEQLSTYEILEIIPNTGGGDLLGGDVLLVNKNVSI